MLRMILIVPPTSGRFPDENIDDLILSHAMNRVRAANSSSSFSEQWAVELHGAPDKVAARRIRPPYIQYADLSDLMLMLDLRLGGGVMDAVNEGQKLLERKDKF